MPERIQVVFQGGGAKLSALIAVAEVLEEFATPQLKPGRNTPDPPRITISRVAGTSAGAIAAVMLASPKPVTEFKRDITANGPTYLGKLKPATMWTFFCVLRGQPLYNRGTLLAIFHDMFRGGPDTIGALRFKTQIYFTNLYSLKAKAAAADDAIPIALAKSCCIPIAFSGYLSDDHDVDGGLALNFPVDHMLAEQGAEGRVIGISFKSEAVPPTASNIIGYVKHLFGAAVQTNVDRSVLQLGKENVFPIDTKIGTFDFAEALTSGLGAQYDNVKFQFRDWLNQWLTDSLPPFDDNAARLVRPILGQAQLSASVVRELHDRFTSEPFTHGEVISAYDTALLDGEGNFTGKYKSKVYNRIRIKKRTNILTYDFQSGKTSASFSDSKFGFMVLDRDSKPLTFSGHVQERTLPGDELRSFRLFLFFDEALIPEAENQPYVIEMQYIVDDPFKGFAGSGDSGVLTRVAGEAGEMILGIALPRKALPQNYRLVDISTLSPLEMKKVNFSPEPAETVVPSQEIDNFHILPHLNLDQPADRYVIVGRRVTDVKQGTTFGWALKTW